MKNEINIQIEVIEGINKALTVASSMDKIEKLKKAKHLAMKTLTLLRNINQ